MIDPPPQKKKFICYHNDFLHTPSWILDQNYKKLQTKIIFSWVVVISRFLKLLRCIEGGSWNFTGLTHVAIFLLFFRLLLFWQNKLTFKVNQLLFLNDEQRGWVSTCKTDFIHHIVCLYKVWLSGPCVHSINSSDDFEYTRCPLLLPIIKSLTLSVEISTAWWYCSTVLFIWSFCQNFGRDTHHFLL